MLSALIDEELDAVTRKAVEEHLVDCDACRLTLAELVRLGVRARAAASPVDVIAGRRTLKEILGQRTVPVWRRRIALPVPVAASLALALVVATAFVVVERSSPQLPAPPLTSSAPAHDDLSKYDGGNPAEIYVARHPQERSDAR